VNLNERRGRLVGTDAGIWGRVGCCVRSHPRLGPNWRPCSAFSLQQTLQEWWSLAFRQSFSPCCSWSLGLSKQLGQRPWSQKPARSFHAALGIGSRNADNASKIDLLSGVLDRFWEELPIP